MHISVLHCLDYTLTTTLFSAFSCLPSFSLYKFHKYLNVAETVIISNAYIIEIFIVLSVVSILNNTVILLYKLFITGKSPILYPLSKSYSAEVTIIYYLFIVLN